MRISEIFNVINMNFSEYINYQNSFVKLIDYQDSKYRKSAAKSPQLQTISKSSLVK
jgi:hypothetical protein